jgi:hypothetical protein
MWSEDLNSNRTVFTEVDDVIRSSAGKTIYMAPMLAPLAIKAHLEYVDNGFREYYAAYVDARKNGTFGLPPLLSWLAARKLGNPEPSDASLVDVPSNSAARRIINKVLERSEVAICIYICPDKATHDFVRNLGRLTTPYGPFVVKLYVKK